MIRLLLKCDCISKIGKIGMLILLSDVDDWSIGVCVQISKGEPIMNEEQMPMGNMPSNSNDDGRAMAVSSLVLGILGLICSCVPIGGLPLSVVGIVLGAISKKKGQDGMATAGIILCIIGIVLAIIAMIFGGYEAVVQQQQSTTAFAP